MRTGLASRDRITRGARRRVAALVGCLAVAAAVAAPAQAAPTYAPAVVDGSAAEWNLAADFFADLTKSGSATGPVVAKAYLRYDCAASALYVLVLAEPLVTFVADDPSEVYVRFDGGPKAVHSGYAANGTPPDFAWIGHSGGFATGFEASAPLAQGAHSIRIHLKIAANDADGYDTADFVGRTAPLDIACQAPPTPPGGGGGGGDEPPGVTAGGVGPGPVDVAVAKSVTPSRTVLGRRATFTVVVRNDGDTTATGVTLVDRLPLGLRLVSLSSGQGTCSKSAPIRCELGTLQPGESATVRIVVTAKALGSLVNVATVSAAEPEDDLSDNRAEATLVVTGRLVAASCVSMTVSRSWVQADRATRVVVTLRRRGQPVRGVRVLARGAGVVTSARSGRQGRARIVLRPTRAGVVYLATTGVKLCRAARIGVSAGEQTPLTG